MNYCPYCGFNLKKYKEPNYCSHCGKKLKRFSSYGLKRVKCGICHKYVESYDNRISCSYCESIFHKSCVYRWILQYNACPLCQNIYLIPKLNRSLL